MTIQNHALTYYEWDDIEAFICEELGIQQAEFRDYHTIIGGEYKDLWHVWITLNYDDVRNDSYCCVWINVLDFDGAEKEYGEWVRVLLPILNKLFDQLGSDHIYVHYSW